MVLHVIGGVLCCSYEEPQEVVKGKVNNKGQREAPLNFYTDADKELANSSESNKIPTKATTAGAYEDVDEKVTKLPLSRNTTSGEVDGPEYEEVPENKTPFYHTLELESTSNGAVMSHQNDDYDQLARGDPSKKADIETTSRADYNTLNVKPESNSYDTLKRGGNSRPDVIDGNEYSHLSKPIASVSSSYDILNRQAKISDANTNTQ
ncbi:hypothetical protein BSL78_04537 [Apostichopus japonicus]|uniref:Uncharacterized protein n=1 Tax=Stichopus japonicus TaxID=307972 RepID=A0A2G8LE47_STIJA|nr:hypothetical protein BSL78_04537 [Apostichopus japonicus]